MNKTKCTISFNGLLTIAFIVMKLHGDIDWSWWWVLCPLWIPMVIGISVLLIWIGILLLGLYEEKRNRWR